MNWSKTIHSMVYVESNALINWLIKIYQQIVESPIHWVLESPDNHEPMGFWTLLIWLLMVVASPVTVQGVGRTPLRHTPETMAFHQYWHENGGIQKLPLKYTAVSICSMICMYIYIYVYMYIHIYIIYIGNNGHSLVRQIMGNHKTEFLVTMLNFRHTITLLVYMESFLMVIIKM